MFPDFFLLTKKCTKATKLNCWTDELEIKINSRVQSVLSMILKLTIFVFWGKNQSERFLIIFGPNTTNAHSMMSVQLQASFLNKQAAGQWWCSFGSHYDRFQGIYFKQTLPAGKYAVRSNYLFYTQPDFIDHWRLCKIKIQYRWDIKLPVNSLGGTVVQQ